jgi:hypothetical protein
MGIKLIDLNSYSKYTTLLPFIEKMKQFDIVSAIETLKTSTDNYAADVDKEYWHHITVESDEVRYYGDWIHSEDDDSDESKKFQGDWRYIKFQHPKQEVPKYIQEIFQPYKEYLKDFPYEIEMHSIVGGARIEDHIDYAGVAIGQSPNRNLLISLDYPTGESVDCVSMHIEHKAFTPEERPKVLFDAQRIHGARNNSNQIWNMILFYVPIDDLEI